MCSLAQLRLLDAAVDRRDAAAGLQSLRHAVAAAQLAHGGRESARMIHKIEADLIRRIDAKS